MPANAGSCSAGEKPPSSPCCSARELLPCKHVPPAKALPASCSAPATLLGHLAGTQILTVYTACVTLAKRRTSVDTKKTRAKLCLAMKPCRMNHRTCTGQMQGRGRTRTPLGCLTRAQAIGTWNTTFSRHWALPGLRAQAPADPCLPHAGRPTRGQGPSPWSRSEWDSRH